MILAIDPGPLQSAFVLWDGARILSKGMRSNEDMIVEIGVNDYTGSTLAIEKIACYGMAVGEETFETVYWSGRFAERWFMAWSRNTLTRITRGEVKMHLCKTMRAKDANVRQAIVDRLGAPGTKRAPGLTYGVSSHLWAALGVALTAWDRMHIAEIDLLNSEIARRA